MLNLEREKLSMLTRSDIKKELIKCFEEVGIVINEEEEDVDINSYGVDSIMYISIIIELENKIGITIPDRYLGFDNFSSLNALSNIIYELYRDQNSIKEQK